MNLFQLVLKNMRQRALGTWLTLLSVMLGTALAVAILVLRHGGESLFAQTDFGYDVLVGTNRGAEERLVLNTVYQIGRSPGVMPYYVFEQLDDKRRPPPGTSAFNFPQHVRLAVPFAVGDTYRGRPIIGTLPRMFGVDDLGNPIDPGPDPEDLSDAIFQYRIGKRFELAQGRVFYERKVDRAAAGTQPASQPTATQPAAPADLLAGSGPAPATPSGPKWEAKFEAVIGAEVARELKLKLGDKFRAIHGESKEEDDPDHDHDHDHGKDGHDKHDDHDHDDDKKPAGRTLDVHEEQWEVVGILKPTGTAADRCLYIPLTTFYCIPKHEEGLAAHTNVRMGQAPGAGRKMATPDEPPPYDVRPDGTVDLKIPMSKWEVSGVYVKARGSIQANNLAYSINNGLIPEAIAVHPGPVMQSFFKTFLQPSATLLLLIAILVSVVAGVGILVSIYNSVSARNREIAVLRALGATRRRVLLVICLEAGLIGLIGAAAGWVLGHLLGAVGSSAMQDYLGQGFNWAAVTLWEVLYVIGVVVGAVLAGLVPALKAYRTPVATNLVAT